MKLGRYVRLKIMREYVNGCRRRVNYVSVCPALEPIRIKYMYFKILHISKSEVLMDQLARTLTRVNVNMVINFIFDLWQERKSKLYC